MKYIVKCDDCKMTIRETDNVRESYQGGQCNECKVEERLLVMSIWSD